MAVASSGKIKPKLDFSFDERQEEQLWLKNENVSSKKSVHDDDISIDENQKIKIKINKVNEMDIKVSRFDNGNANRVNLEEVIPNEEPLIQIRQFNGAGSHQHGGIIGDSNHEEKSFFTLNKLEDDQKINVFNNQRKRIDAELLNQ